MFLDESTVTTTSAPDQIELRTDVSAPVLVESVNRWRYTSKSASKLHALVYNKNVQNDSQMTKIFELNLINIFF